MFGTKILGGAAKVGPYGPIQFPGCNWRKGSYGALPFGVQNRVWFQTGFWTVSLVGLGLPFYSN
jgi:hypothetical protein